MCLQNSTDLLLLKTTVEADWYDFSNVFFVLFAVLVSLIGALLYRTTHDGTFRFGKRLVNVVGMIKKKRDG